jgi:hypothetical protein
VTVVDSRRGRSGGVPSHSQSLRVLEPGLSPSVAVRLVLGLVVAGAGVDAALTLTGSWLLKATFVLACLLGPAVGRPSGLTRVLRALPLAWIVCLTVSAAGTLLVDGAALGVKTVALNVATSVVLFAPWLWIGWGCALAVTFARGGLHRAR